MNNSLMNTLAFCWPLFFCFALPCLAQPAQILKDSQFIMPNNLSTLRDQSFPHQLKGFVHFNQTPPLSPVLYYSTHRFDRPYPLLLTSRVRLNSQGCWLLLAARSVTFCIQVFLSSLPTMGWGWHGILRGDKGTSR